MFSRKPTSWSELKARTGMSSTNLNKRINELQNKGLIKKIIDDKTNRPAYEYNFINDEFLKKMSEDSKNLFNIITRVERETKGEITSDKIMEFVNNLKDHKSIRDKMFLNNKNLTVGALKIYLDRNFPDFLESAEIDAKINLKPTIQDKKETLKTFIHGNKKR